MFMVKKLLMGPRFLELDGSTESMNELVRLILSSPELRLHKFDGKIDFEKWTEGMQYIPVKRTECRRSTISELRFYLTLDINLYRRFLPIEPGNGRRMIYTNYKF